MLQAFLTNFVYSQRTEAIFAQDREALLHLRKENEKLAAKLNEASTNADISFDTVELATTSLRNTAEYRSRLDAEVAKL